MTDTETSSRTRPGNGAAAQIAALLTPVVGGDLPVRLTAWDGSQAGPEDAPGVRLNSPNALRRQLWAPGELGAAQAYVTGELDIETPPGMTDAEAVDAALTHAWSVAAERGLAGVRLRPKLLLEALGTLRRTGALGGPVPAPASQAQLRGRLHTLGRDRRAIGHHYDFSNAFYEAILGPEMAYSCGYYQRPEMSLEQAQRAKLDLVCDKLGVGPGSRLLDVGCGWGSLSLHAAEHYGARVLGVTIAAEQKRFIDARIAERGLADRVQIRLQDYREVRDGGFDAVASIEMGEHVGLRNYPTYAAVLHRNVRPGGSVLVQQMSRRGRHPGGGPFIESFIAPDMQMRPVGETVGLLEAAGLEVRGVQALREHYVWTVRDWLSKFEAAEDRLRALVGEEQIRVWRLYLVGGMMSFRDGRMGVDQILLRRSAG